jgi:hypothetical protein
MRVLFLTISTQHIFDDVTFNGTYQFNDASLSMRIGSPVFRGFDTGPLVKVLSADAGSVAAITDAAHLWNSYHPHYTGPPSTVQGHIVQNWDAFSGIGGSTIGLARCAACYNYQPRLCCGIIDLYVVHTAGVLTFDVFVHEIAHAVLPATATSYDDRRVLRPDHHHWDPPEDNEIFGPFISPVPHLGPYTVAAAATTTTIACNAEDLPCAAPLQCSAMPAGYRRVPSMCKAADAPPQSHNRDGTASYDDRGVSSATAADDSDEDDGYGSLALYIGLAVALAITVVAIGITLSETAATAGSATTFNDMDASEYL